MYIYNRYDCDPKSELMCSITCSHIYNIFVVQFDTAHKFVSCRATEQTQLFIWKGELHAAMTSQKNKTEEMKKSVIYKLVDGSDIRQIKDL